MTIREIAEVAGVSINTVFRKAKQLFPAKFQNGKKTFLASKEALEVMKAVRKVNFVLPHSTAELRQNTAEPSQNDEVALQNDEVAHLAREPGPLGLGSSLANALRSIARGIELLEERQRSQEIRLQNIETRIDQREALLPAPDIKPRDHVTKLVREAAHRTQIEHREVWNNLYREFGYRTNTNPMVCAKNRGMTIIDYIEAEGQLEVLESVAVDFLAIDEHQENQGERKLKRKKSKGGFKWEY